MLLKNLIFCFLVLITSALATTRLPTVAGQFYPENPKILQQTIDNLLQKASPLQVNGPIKALIVPHAGYQFSARVAANAYRQVAHLQPKTIILLGPSHFVYLGDMVALSSADAWQTPLGKVSLDTQIRDHLLKEAPFIHIDDQAHRREHALEVQLPFIQTLFPKAQIVPIAINSLKVAQRFAGLLSKYITSETLLIVSTDMSHYHSLQEAQHIDHQTIKALVAQDIPTLRNELTKHTMEMCGQAAVVTLLELSKILGAMNMTPLRYSHSGLHTNEQSGVVGYFSALLSRPQDYQNLLDYAYRVLSYHVNTGKMEAPVLQKNTPFYTTAQGVFVTLRLKPKRGEIEGQLRGCIGIITPTTSLRETIRQMTMASASQDERFSPVTTKELSRIQIQLSLLSPPKRVLSANDIKFGHEGVILTQGPHSGVFLPEVAATFSSKKQFLEELCTQKAHLPRTCYKDPHTKIHVFSSVQFE